ncbi:MULTISPECIES: ArsR/SmtB family transcription factor [Rhizobium]|uniref:Metalloregulator ArsR/SmtB family transcription factor n=1 Tax=Rhizobium rhododendri TaxID=2506430 RepID=A0ABY8IF37_9HYPH|nr:MULTISPECIES: metalloregulator ArsR/SmtB family transcription factor [Rhizobium]MBZ5758916.1 metalloregulator ArsR/SmtB family transcription factor [Rhizobium sp. VS19-DR96]MBZ5764254.1 metalloregulator ArsR/SmtB family transcription factor [Rhizobium sp. VS19-DR129.2]MBZ5771797.1 metalloregulator ArsR/SmtB family transcription factor [Rhizobium sp. VS19-DRK62.2]MBZ5783516.1 metalloregulator ArsR/SmtB family transcription factor [Rhizobium sp. VS19-DR121]MBZ5800964.1 metalloregulator ArsR/S
MGAEQQEKLMRDQASLLAMMANPARLTILRLLLEEERSVGQLATQVGLSENATSMHLAKLRRGRVVTTKRKAQNIFYAAKSINVVVILNALDAISHNF